MRTGMFISLINAVLLGTFLLPESGWGQNDVTLSVNMRVKMQEGVFEPENGDRIVLQGDHNNWSGSDDVLEDNDADSVYAITVNFDAHVASRISFKFVLLRLSGFPIFEDRTARRQIELTGVPQALPAVYFDGDSTISPEVESGKVKFFADMQVMRQLDLFQAEEDSVQILGPFNGWGFVASNSKLTQNAFDPDLYSLNATVLNSPGETVLHRLALGAADGPKQAREEMPLTTGGLAREVIFATTASQNTQPVYFNDLPPQGVIPQNQSVQCGFQVDMRPAMRAANTPFQPSQDRLYLVLMDPWWADSQGRELGAQGDWQLFDADGDSIFDLSASIDGKSGYGLIYRYGYGSRSDSLKMIEGGDLEIHPSRVRYIQPIKANDFPTNFAFPRDIWQSTPGLPVETPPFSSVPPANKPPYVENTIPSQTIPLNNNAYNIDLLGSLNVFRDPNGDELAFSASVADETVLNAGTNGSLLTIQPIKIGTTSVKITADDRKGGSAETSFSVSVVEGNQPPRVINTLSKQILTAGGAQYAINLSLIFEDPNGDPMTFRAVSSAPNIATALVFAGILRVSPLFVGSTTISVTAEDNRGGAKGTSFIVDVVSGNQPPRLENEISSQTLALNGSPYVRDLNASPSVFVDPNGDELNYSTTSSNNSVASAAVSGSELSISALSIGTTEITVFANDGKGGSATAKFNVQTVASNSNRSPQIINAIESQVLIEGGAPFSRNLDQPPTVFRDPDGDPMFYTATSSEPEAADVTIFGSLLSIAPTKQGNARIEVTATDGFGGSKTMNFDIRVTINHPPVIQHKPAESQNAGQPIVVDASIFDDTGVTSAIIHYRRGGDSNFSPVAMTNIGGSWQGTIPGGDVTSRGIEYMLEAFDQSQTSSVSALAAVPVALTGEGEHRGSPQFTGKDQNAYRLFSMPFQIFEADPADVLVDDLGDYDTKKWRFFELRPDQTYAEFGEARAFVPGRAFWLIVREAGKLIDSGAGMTSSTARPFKIPLHPHWNFIANPFNFAIPVTNLQLAGSAETPELLDFQGAWSDAGDVAEIKPFAGYALFLNSVIPDTLLVNPQKRASTGKVAKAAQHQQLDWSVRIVAKGQAAEDRDNVIGVSQVARDGYDRLDKPEPPVIGDYVRLAFDREEWRAMARDFASDIRRDFVDGAVWDFNVITAKQQIVTLHFDGLDALPPAFEIYLIDENAQLAKKLHKGDTYAFAAFADQRARPMQLVVGEPKFLANVPALEAQIPGSFELAQNYPNPFNPVTTIRFGLPKQAEVSLQIYNVLGKHVAELLSGKKLAAGYHTAMWNGKDAGGRAMSSGLYFYRLQVGKTHLVKKMILVK